MNTELKEAMAYRVIEGHTPAPWEWARDKYTREEFLSYCAESWDNADPATDFMNVVQAEVDGENRTVAILGNGPTAHRNGPLISAAPDLQRHHATLKAEVERLTKLVIDTTTQRNELFENNLKGTEQVDALTERVRVLEDEAERKGQAYDLMDQWFSDQMTQNQVDIVATVLHPTTQGESND